VRVIGYVRLSKAGNGHGIDQQRAAVVAHCERQGWELIGIEEDDGASGKSTKKRAGLARALESLEAGRADALVAAKLDRLSRSLLDFASLVEQGQRQGWSLVVVDQSFDLGTSSGRAMAGMLAVFAQFEREMIAERTKAGLAVAKRKGKKLGGPLMQPADPEVVKKIMNLRRRGLSLQQIADKLTSDGVPTTRGAGEWRKDVIYRIVTRAGESSSALEG
jgi:DNA invertase Pin-like site-specific DNA recombinase